MNNYLFFDSASTTKCCEAATELLLKYANEDYGNPASNHFLGQKAARAIRDARQFFAGTFRVKPEQVIFTGSGTEANNLALQGIAHSFLKKNRDNQTLIPLFLCTAIEHPAVRKTVLSLSDFGFETEILPVDPSGQISKESLDALLTSSDVSFTSPDLRFESEPPFSKKNFSSPTNLAVVSIQQVNNILGTQLPVETLATTLKKKFPKLIFHTDAVQAFGKVPCPRSGSAVDLVSLSAHKIGGPKGVGALIVLNPSLLQRIRPLIFGGGQENGMRSGTQNAGLIAGFHVAAKSRLESQKTYHESAELVRQHFKESLIQKGLFNEAHPLESKIHWNSPANALPHIVSLSLPGYPAAPLAKLLEERRCLVSVGSACHSRKPEPDPVLSAIGLPLSHQTSAIRISFSPENTIQESEILAQALDESIQLMDHLLGKKKERKNP